MRAIKFSSIRTHSSPLFQQLKFVDVIKLHQFSVLTFMYDLLSLIIARICSILMQPDQKGNQCYTYPNANPLKDNSQFLSWE